MAFLALAGGISGDLNTAAYQYGYFDDVVLVVDGNTFGYTIQSYEGNDRIDASRTTLSTNGLSVYAGSGNDTIVCGASSSSIYDGSGNDSVRGGKNTDVIYASAGNDTYDGGSGVDYLEFGLLSYDGIGPVLPSSSVKTGLTVDLAKTTAQSFGIYGKDTLKNIECVSGGFGPDTLLGTSGANEIAGGDEKDQLTGRGGADRLNLGDSTGFFRDTVNYISITDSGTNAATWDTIIAFDKGTAATDDRIDLSAIDATPAVSGNQAFVWRGTAAFTSSASGEVRLVVSGTDTLVYVDTDADAGAEMVIKVQNVTGLAKTDFIL